MSHTRFLGLSTHRRIHPDALPAIENAAVSLLKEVKAKAEKDGKALVMLNSLAEGGDTMLARAAIALKIPYIAILPRSLESYAEDFEGDAKREFFALCESAEAVSVTPDIEKTGEDSYDYFYRQAGIYVAARSDLFIALWDGVAGKPNGCGAAEAYGFATKADYRDPTGDYPVKARTVWHILTPRPTQDPTGAGKITKTEIKP